jgi:uroporphyrin-III C-methyltransferase/precorrin-2 dehydrogenase/sirohydrochlorin ferrochelatase
MEYLPLFFSLQEEPVLIVGGGRVALRKARLVIEAGARVSVVSPDIDHELEAMLAENGGTWVQDSYRASHLENASIVIVATPDREVNSIVASAARARKLPVNVVDDPALCSFVFPAIIDRSPLVIAVSSSAKSPVLARLVRSKIEALIPAAFGRLAEFTGRFREAIKTAAPAEGQRRRFWEQVVNGPVGEMVLAGREEDAAAIVQSYIDNPGEAHPLGEVYLIGAGPGDPDLLSFKAARLLQAADVVLYDRLVSPRVLDMARRDADRMYVGKRRSDHSVPQQQINQLLLDLAQQGKCVVRLKGGDPFIFGRGGEEIELLAEHGIPFQVIPGVTAASGCACYAGIPLTHRDHAQSVRFLTANLKSDRVELPWDQLQSEQETLVFYMGLQGLETICTQLQAHGRPGDTAIALIEQGTTVNQRTHVGTLATMVNIVAGQKVHAPTLIIVGSVVTLHGQFSWFGESAEPGSWSAPRGMV